MNADATIFDVSPEVMQPNVDMLCSWSVLVLSCDFDGARIIFEHFAVDLGLLMIYFNSARLQFFEEVHDGDGFSKCI